VTFVADGGVETGGVAVEAEARKFREAGGVEAACVAVAPRV
jgi:hypothetical protein